MASTLQLMQRAARRHPGVVIALALLFAASQAALLVVAAVHVASGSAAIHSDFASSWLGGGAWRTAGSTHAYNINVQSALYARIAPGVPLIYPNTWAPTSLLLTIPFSLVPLGAAFDAWLGLQAVLLVAAACIAVRAAAPQLRGRRLFIAVTGAVISAGTIATVLFGQWDGVAALGVALAVMLWRRDHAATGAALLTALLLSGKPHLAIGFLAFMLAAGGSRVRAGCAAACALTFGIDIALVHPSGLQAWLHTLTGIAALPAAGSLSVFGFFAITVGGGGAASALGYASAAVLVFVSGWFGWMWRRGATLEQCLLGAGCASLLISPHLFTQDLAVLMPLVAALVARALAGHDDLRAAATCVAWCLLSIAAEYQIVPLGFQRPDAMVALALLGGILIAARSVLPAHMRLATLRVGRRSSLMSGAR